MLIPLLRLRNRFPESRPCSATYESCLKTALGGLATLGSIDSSSQLNVSRVGLGSLRNGGGNNWRDSITLGMFFQRTEHIEQKTC
jgi:hypothetical protein